VSSDVQLNYRQLLHMKVFWKPDTMTARHFTVMKRRSFQTSGAPGTDLEHLLGTLSGTNTASSEACCAHVECTSVVVSLDMGCIGMSLRGGRKGVRAQWSVTLVTQGQAQGRPRLNPFSAMQNWCRLAGSIALCLPLPSSHLIFIANLQYQNGGHHHELCAEQHQTEPGNCLSQPLCWGACPAGSRMHTGNCTPCERGGNKGAVHPEQKRRELLPSSPHVHVSSVSSCWAPSASRVW